MPCTPSVKGMWEGTRLKETWKEKPSGWCHAEHIKQLGLSGIGQEAAGGPGVWSPSVRRLLLHQTASAWLWDRLGEHRGTQASDSVWSHCGRQEPLLLVVSSGGSASHLEDISGDI